MRKFDYPQPGDRSPLGMLTVESVEKAVWGSGKRTVVICLCACGKSGVRIEEKKFRTGHTRSCGCEQHRRKDLSRTPEYRAWAGMMKRCTDEKNRSYPDYGGRGITVHPKYEDFLLFLEDIGPRPSPKHSLGRKDNDGNYEPGNVRWETKRQQSTNTRRSRMITFDGRTMTMLEWSEETGIPYPRLQMRLNAGWPPEKALTLPDMTHEKRWRKSQE